MPSLKIIPAALAAGIMTFGTAFAKEIKVGTLVLAEPVIRANTPGTKVTAGYLTIRNTGTEPDFLLAAESPIAGLVQIHTVIQDDGVARMRPADLPMEIPAGGEVVFKPGGFHIMFMRMEKPVEAGEEHRVILRFENAGAIDAVVGVKSTKEIGGALGDEGHSSHDHGSHGHGDHSGHTN